MIFLDTNICIDILNGNQLLENLLEKYNTKIFAIAAPTVFELYYGIYKLNFLKKDLSPKKFEKLKRDMDEFIKKLNVFPMTEGSADLGAKMHLELKAAGIEIDVFDCLIASIILSNDYSKIITKNMDHFNRIQKLELLPI